MFERFSAEAKNLLQPLLGDLEHVDFSRPAESSHGDLATTLALSLAKKLKQSPRDIAQTIADALKGMEGVANVEVAGAGYVNVWLTPSALLEELHQTRKACSPKKISKKTKPVVIDYSQPNIAKPLGVHHILSTVLGQSLGNLYEHEGQPVVRWNYLGDWGTQFGKLAVAFEKWGEKKAKDCTIDELLALYVKFHQEAEKDATLEDEARETFLKLEQGDKKLRAFWEDVVAVTKSTLGDIYNRLNVRFDLDVGESYYEDKMMPVVEEGKQKGVFTEGEKGALIAQFPDDTNMPPAIVLKGDGATIYLTRDLAMMKDRMERFDAKKILFVVDVAQSLHFQQLFAVVGQLGWDLPELEHVFFGRMRFADSSMSTRKGNILKLEHVLDEAVARAEEIIKERGDAIQTDDPKDLAEMMGVGALVYGILSQSRKMDMVFDWEKMLAFEGNSAPYLQYTHARAKSVLRKAATEQAFGLQDVEVFPEIDTLTDKERTLIQTLLQFTRALEEARSEHLPHKLANYLYALCQEFNAFYNAEPILQSAEPQKALRLALTSLVASVLKTGASLLTLRVPERM